MPIGKVPSDEPTVDEPAEHTPDRTWEAAKAVYDRAVVTEDTHELETALELYVDVTHRMAGATTDGPRELLICALNDVALMSETLGRLPEARQAAEEILSGHFDDPPTATGALAITSAGMIELRLLKIAGEWDAGVALAERLVERYGQPSCPQGTWTAVMAGGNGAWMLAQTGNHEEAVRRYDRALARLHEPVPPELERVLAGILVGKAESLDRLGRFEQRNALCSSVVERFASTDDAETLEHVSWAATTLRTYAEWKKEVARLSRAGSGEDPDAEHGARRSEVCVGRPTGTPNVSRAKAAAITCSRARTTFRRKCCRRLASVVRRRLLPGRAAERKTRRLRERGHRRVADRWPSCGGLAPAAMGCADSGDRAELRRPNAARGGCLQRRWTHGGAVYLCGIRRSRPTTGVGWRVRSQGRTVTSDLPAAPPRVRLPLLPEAVAQRSWVGRR